MAKRKFIVDDDGTVRLVNMLKSGEVSQKDQQVMTDEVIEAMLKHLIASDDFINKRIAGYRIPSADHKSAVWMCVFDEDVYELKVKEKTINENTPQAIPKKRRTTKKNKSEEK